MPTSRGTALPALLAPVGSSRWGMAAALAIALGALLVAPAAGGQPVVGSALALGFVLTAVPSLPTSWRPALATMTARAAAVLIGGAAVVACAQRPVLICVLTVAAAVAGALLTRVGATAGLAVVLISVDAGTTPSWTVLVLYALGAVAVFAAWALWWSITAVVARGDAPPAPVHPAPPGRSAHAARVALATAVAVTVAALLPAGLVGGHWLVTSVLLTIQPARAATGLRLAQRLSGNTVGAVLAAVLLDAHPPVAVAVAVTVVLFAIAVALRPVNYTWWAITGPPVLLVISEYPHWFPWYEGGVRLAMNLAGAAIVVTVVFGLPVVARGFRHRPRSDSVYKIQTEEAR